MLVNYKAKLFYGYLMTPKEVDNLSITNKYYLIENVEFLHILNYYEETPNLYVFGVCCETTEYITAVSLKDKKIDDKELMRLYQQYFGKIDIKPEFYIGLQIL